MGLALRDYGLTNNWHKSALNLGCWQDIQGKVQESGVLDKRPNREFLVVGKLIRTEIIREGEMAEKEKRIRREESLQSTFQT